MYLEHLGLKESPFSIAPDPRYLYMSEGHREALAHLLYGINNDAGFVLLSGEVGTGKTTVCRRLLEDMPQDVETAFVLNPKLTSSELLATVCDEFGITYPEGNTSLKVFTDRITGYLLEIHAQGKRAVLILEEAQNLAPEVLEQLRLLTNLETSRRKLLQIILLGQPELREMLDRPELLQLAQRITARYHLGPLSRNELEGYVIHRLSVAGCRERLFQPSLMPKLFRLSKGIPRVINVICDRALLGAYAQGKHAVDRRTLSGAAKEVLGKSRRALRPAAFRRSLAGLSLLVFGVLLASGYHHLSNRPQESQRSDVSRVRAKTVDTELLPDDSFPLWWMPVPYNTHPPAQDRDFSGSGAGSPRNPAAMEPRRGGVSPSPEGQGNTAHAEITISPAEAVGDETGRSPEPETTETPDERKTGNVIHP